MKFSIPTLVAAGAATVSAQQVLQLQAVFPATPFPFVSAAGGGIHLNQPTTVPCAGLSLPFASFFTQQGALLLYTPDGQRQQVYADMTPEGRGKLGYTAPGQPVKDGQAAGGWGLDPVAGLTWNGGPLFACSGSAGPQGPWDVYVPSPGISGLLCQPMRTVGVPDRLVAGRCTYP